MYRGSGQASRKVDAGCDVSKIAIMTGGIRITSWPATTAGRSRLDPLESQVLQQEPR